MKTLINLIGEQPIPNLLPPLYLKSEKNILLYTDTTEKAANRIKRLLSDCVLKKMGPYDLTTAINDIKSVVDSQSENVFNITGATKIMSIAAYQVAKENKSKFVYLQSEGRRSLLFTYSPEASDYRKPLEEEIPELVNCDLYLKAHLPDYYTTGYSAEPNSNRLTSGGEFEKAICDSLDKQKFEFLSGIRPKGVGNQIEIDLVIRLKGTNNVGIAEIKLGDKREEGPKKGLDQLVMAAEREYLGTYTTRFLITQSNLSKQIKELAAAHHICIIDDLQYEFRNQTLTSAAVAKLNDRIKEKLS
jgi:hypothetical protein